jgi:CheY-like chemotaxis protein
MKGPQVFEALGLDEGSGFTDSHALAKHCALYCDEILEERTSTAIQNVVALAIRSSNNPKVNKNILYVDDNKVMLDLIKLLLGQAGYTAMTAQNVDEALRIAKETSFGAMVIDVNLAGDSGLMLMNFMMNDHKGVPVILYSGGEHQQPNVEKMVALGASKFVHKRNGSELVAAVKQLCSLD